MTAYIFRRVSLVYSGADVGGIDHFYHCSHRRPAAPSTPTPTGASSTPSTEKVLRARFGMDLPVWRQFTRYMFFDIETDPKTKQPKIVWGAIGGNLGPTYSSRGAETVQHYLFTSTSRKPSRFYYSARLGLQALGFALFFGIPLGRAGGAETKYLDRLYRIVYLDHLRRGADLYLRPAAADYLWCRARLVQRDPELERPDQALDSAHADARHGD